MKKIITSIVLSLGLCFSLKAQSDTANVYEFKLGAIGTNGGAGTYRRMNYNRWQNQTGTGMYTMGNVGFGTNTPAYKVDVNGVVRIGSTTFTNTTDAFTINTNPTSLNKTFIVQVGDEESGIETNGYVQSNQFQSVSPSMSFSTASGTNGGIFFAPSGSVKGIWRNDGFLGINVTNAPAAIAARLHIQGGTEIPLLVVSSVRGIVPPQLTTIQRNSIDGVLPGEYIYNTDTGELNYWDATVGIWRRIVKNDLPPEYADNATALAGGLQVGDRYRTGDALKVVH